MLMKSLFGGMTPTGWWNRILLCLPEISGACEIMWQLVSDRAIGYRFLYLSERACSLKTSATITDSGNRHIEHNSKRIEIELEFINNSRASESKFVPSMPLRGTKNFSLLFLSTFFIPTNPHALTERGRNFFPPSQTPFCKTQHPHPSPRPIDNIFFVSLDAFCFIIWFYHFACTSAAAGSSISQRIQRRRTNNMQIQRWLLFEWY